MKIATFKVNNINRRLDNLLAWLSAARPNVVCLHELKAKQQDFPLAQIKEAGYDAVRRGERSWNDVAILAKDAEPVLTRATLPGDASDRQARHIEAAVKGVLIGCLHLPNGNPRPVPKFTYKFACFERLIVHAADLLAAKVPVA
jgi:exodeoxyribonuclease-3